MQGSGVDLENQEGRGTQHTTMLCPQPPRGVCGHAPFPEKFQILDLLRVILAIEAL